MEIISLIIAGLALCGGIITVYVNLNLKVKEIEIKMIGIEEKICAIKIDTLANNIILDKKFDKIYNQLDRMEGKMDDKFEELTIIKTKFSYEKEK